MAKALKINKEKIKRGDLIFYCVFLAWPILQFCVFYIGVNFNTVLMSFQEIRFVGNETAITYTLSNYKRAFEWMGGEEFRNLISVTLKSYVVNLVFSLPLGLLFAYYIFKKLPGWGVFRVILFLPSILSSVVTAAMFRAFVDLALPRIIEDGWYAGIKNTPVDIGTVKSLLDANGKTSFATLMFYNIWVGFGTSVLMYSNKMAGISDEIIESAHLDGATGLKEFWHIVLPMTYSTISVFLITGIAQICINQYGVYSMYAGMLSDNRLRNLGYWFYCQVAQYANNDNGLPQLTYYASLGVILTFVTMPITLTIRWALNKFGPSEE